MNVGGVSVPTPGALADATAILAAMADPVATRERLDAMKAATLEHQNTLAKSIELSQRLGALEKSLADREAAFAVREQALTDARLALAAKEQELAAREQRLEEAKRDLRHAMAWG
jgi:hypothetical protein